MNEELITHETESRKLEQSILLNEENEKNFSKTLDLFKSQVKELEKSKEKIEKQTAKLQQEKMNREKVFRKFQESNSKFLDYQIFLKQDLAKMDEFKHQSQSLDKESSELIAKRNTLEQKLPHMENEKQAMVKARNFKVFSFDFITNS